MLTSCSMLPDETMKDIYDFIGGGRNYSQGLVYVLNKSGDGYSVVKGRCNDYNVRIRPTFKGLPVTAIGACAFINYEELISVSIPDSVITIGRSAFENCISLTYVNIPNSVITIEAFAFYACSNLTRVSISDSVKSIERWSFRDCDRLASVHLGKGITSIGDQAFENCKSLSSITIPDSVVSIGDSTFGGCSNLRNITIPSSILSIGDFTFHGCSLKYNEYDNGYYLGNDENPYVVLVEAQEDVSSFKTNDNTRFIYTSAFSNCKATEITIGNSITSISKGAFFGCNNLTSINVGDNNLYYKTIDGNLYSKDGKALVQYALGKKDESFYIPESVTSIDSDAFRSCKNIQSVTIPNSVIEIKSVAFAYCDSLTTINYRGTEEQWDAISKDADWDLGTSNYTVVYNHQD